MGADDKRNVLRRASGYRRFRLSSLYFTKNLQVMPTLKERYRCVIRPYVTVESVRLLGLPRTVAEWVAEGQHGKVSQGY